MLNQVVLVGRLVRDPELRKTANDISVASFTIAIDNLKGSDGQKSASFIPCTAWGATADNTCKFLTKGSLTGVSGRLNQRSYDRKDGTKVTILEVVCDSVQFLEPKAKAVEEPKATGESIGWVPQISGPVVDPTHPLESINIVEDPIK